MRTKIHVSKLTSDDYRTYISTVILQGPKKCVLMTDDYKNIGFVMETKMP